MVDTRSYDQLRVSTFDTSGELAAAVADDLAVVLRQAIAEQGEASAIFATGNSQLAFFQELHTRDDIAWNRVSIFHMDEYMDLSDQHPASFRYVLQKRLVDLVRPRAFYGIAGDTRDVAAELARYTALLESQRPIACTMGIGENGHPCLWVLQLLHQNVNVECSLAEVALHRATFLPIVVRSICICRCNHWCNHYSGFSRLQWDEPERSWLCNG